MISLVMPKNDKIGRGGLRTRLERHFDPFDFVSKA